MSQPTAQQQAAIAARGNVLVVAGAGAGKTRTLVDRCLAWLLDAQNPGSIDQILMVTFTEAAAAEMRQRLRAQLEAVQAADPSPHVAEQLALLETAWICTLHSFCFRLVREHFYTLGLDPQLIVLPEERAQLLARQALDSVLQQNYSLQTDPAKAIQETIQSLGGDSDLPVRDAGSAAASLRPDLARSGARGLKPRPPGSNNPRPAHGPAGSWRSWKTAAAPGCRCCGRNRRRTRARSNAPPRWTASRKSRRGRNLPPRSRPFSRRRTGASRNGASRWRTSWPRRAFCGPSARRTKPIRWPKTGIGAPPPCWRCST